MKRNYKYLKAGLILLVSGMSSQAFGQQQWSPSASYTDQSSIYRMGRVGIGISNSLANLEVRGTNDPWMALSSSANASIRLSVASCNTCWSALSITNDVVLSSGLGQTENLLLLSNRGGRSIKFITKNLANYEVLGMELTSEGRLGLGTSSPAAKVEVATDEDAPFVLNRTNNNRAKTEIIFRQTGQNKWAVGHDQFGNNGNNFYIHDSNDGISRLFIDGSSGGVGINKSNIPANADLATNRVILGEPNGAHSGSLQVNGSGGWGYNIMSRAVNNSSSPTKLYAGLDISGPTEQEVFTVYSNGQTKIGYKSASNHLDAMLTVDGKIATKAINVTAGPWADYVFEKDYKLASLTEVESFIKENKHLPEIPSAAEVEKEGIDVATMDALLLKKIEELTLHMIEMQKQNALLKERLQALELKK